MSLEDQIDLRMPRTTSSRTETRVHICDRREIGTPLVGDEEAVGKFEEEVTDEFMSMVNW